MKIDFYKKSGEKDKSVEYPKALEAKISTERILEYIRYLRTVLRPRIAKTKDRSEVAGGGKKPWRQKGTGHARHGSIRSPIWVGGGKTFGPNEKRQFKFRMNKKERRAALLAVITAKVANKAAFGISSPFSTPKTKDAALMLRKLPISGKTAVFLPKNDENFLKSFKNIPFCLLITAEKPDILSILSADSLLFTKESLRQLTINFSTDKKVKKND